MPSASAAAASRGGEGGNLLKGSDLPKSTNKIKIVCVEVREAPDEFKSALIMDIEPLYGREGFPLNKTNTKALITLIDDDYEKWSGWEITLEKNLTRNPTTNQQAWGLVVTGATKLRRKVTRHDASE